MGRTTEMALGVFGGLFGFAGAMMALFIGMAEFVFTGSSQLIAAGANALVFSALAVIGAVMVEIHAKVGGGLMMVSGILILPVLDLFGVVPALLLVPAGVMGMVRKTKPELPKNLAA
ncbi:hypothetical protein [Planococcus lenghuensis]|uniref:DUF4064 domain-containing protein n=1 Tax=Planococcus lenghuensis TaxID=2213202 RepID=A0A1Q2KVR1_9BACL|nr:hypothetical protein [Planococcus lenghuensis]AQQ52206.1 hypothetical protein B0X71_03140 [Planococcus lenghuensis]